MNSAGRITLPAAVRRELRLDQEGFFEIEIQKGAVVLKPVAVVPLEQAKAHLPEFRRPS
jgi:bifunctional DNA-binding transcriptional regulator/antitoxin component of YhaV-PrlF toxin-antitoxin module